MKRLVVGIAAGVLVASSLGLPAHASENPVAPATPSAVRTAPAAPAAPTIGGGDDTVDELALHEAHVAQQAETAAEPIPGDAAAREAASQRTALDAGTDAGGFVAAATAPFTAGNLISDSNFRNGSAMTEAEIQAFLKRMVGTCSSSSCLANLKMNTPTRTWSFGTCATYRGGTAEPAARIIYKVQRACNLSAKVILVTLQKEQSLLTDPAPTAGVLRKAMGYGCPDTAECDSTYYGFFNQVFAAARQLTWYGNPNGSFTWLKVGQANRILFHPDAARCGGSNVTIKNSATAALYYYTPYQPNAAALSNLYGTGDACSSYGNRNFWRMYRDWFGDPRVSTAIPITRMSGEDRYETAAAISKRSYPTPGVPVVYIASGLDFADALAAAPAAAHQGGPLLLTTKWTVPSATLTELKRLAPQRIVIAGGWGAVGGPVATALAAIAPTARVGGVDRFETSRLLADQAFDSAAVAYLATGHDFPDGLSAGAAAGAQGVPVVLVDGAAGQLDAATLTTLTALNVAEVRIAGGTGAVSAGIASSLSTASLAVKRYGGADRYATSVALNQAAFGMRQNVFMATGTVFPDALSGAAAAGAAGDPLYLARPTCVPSPVRSALLAHGATSLTLLGGPGALNDRVAYLRLC
ncbi:cell wall-binding repeat-containing protein [Agromyces sp. SYSU K20354]|uniref:cell wall-binding repeat-containing protein n=1 Tax=Agromyces cavernae TaxID=2898659 RepID=UPI001E5EE42B|nr:cell wall-binding repeat-containing protein [Agromyces cavernae]MCD2444055.1 cell wall-binding repeat-containing protein [Agromyces cavernae]